MAKKLLSEAQMRRFAKLGKPFSQSTKWTTSVTKKKLTKKSFKKKNKYQMVHER